MKAKLIKKHDHWTLWNQEGKCIANTINADGFPFKLSKKNCQAIENGYDLDELAEKVCPDVISSANSAYKAGFQKALEILGDRRFTEEDLEWLSKAVQEKCYNNQSMNTSVVNKLKSLQQNEWEVEIVREEVAIGDKYTPEPKPKLDADGCIILKRV